MASPDSHSSWCFADPLLQIFSREDYALVTRALQMSFSPDPDQSPTPDPPSPQLLIPTPAGSGSDLDTPPPKRRRIPATKRKSRASKRSNTTFITADPANFRQMVQQVTGVRIGSGHQVALPSAVLKPEAQRPTRRLPTLDTSTEYLLDNYQLQQRHDHLGSSNNYPMSTVASLVGDQGGLIHFPAVGHDMSSLPVFPTLESWEVM